ncbi:MAG: LysR family transcriptional regulator [Litoreibacter sp.]
MPRHLPPLNALRAFEAAGRHESFSRAAEELGVSHSAISKHVRGLEDRLGAQLFRDLPRGVALTSEGARYLGQLVPAFDMIAEATEQVSGREDGVVHVNAEVVFALKWLVPNLGDFYTRFPDITLELDVSRHLADIARYEADIALRYFLHGQPEGDSVLISDAPIFPYAAPQVAEQIAGDPARLLDFKLLRDRASDPWVMWFDVLGRRDLLEKLPDQRKRMRALLAIEATIAGQGVLLGSAEGVANDVKAGRLVRCFDTGFRQGSYHMLFGVGVLRRKPVRLFRDWLVEQTQMFRDNDQPIG